MTFIDSPKMYVVKDGQYLDFKGDFGPKERAFGFTTRSAPCCGDDMAKHYGGELVEADGTPAKLT